MPTGAKLVGAIALALVGWAMADVIMFRNPELAEPTPRVSALFFAAVGAFCGWRFIGSAARRGYGAAWRGGIFAALFAYIIAVILATGADLWEGLSRHNYKNVTNLIASATNHVQEHGVLILDVPTAIALAFGGLLAGIFAGFAARLWN